MATNHDFAATWKTIVDTNWQTGVIAKPEFILARGVRKTRKKHTVNTIYFYTHERFDPIVHWVTRDYTVILPVQVIGLSLSDHNKLLQTYDDAAAEHLDDPGRTFQYVKTVWLPHVKTRPRIRYMTEGETALTVFAEDITT